MRLAWRHHSAGLLLGLGLVSVAAAPFAADAMPGAVIVEWREVRALFLLGAYHIASGWDHLAFLLGLLLFGLTWRQLVKIITAFTVAHSTTLALAALGWITPPSALIEPLIALTVAYVGLANLLWRKHGHSVWLVFAFGLVHGFGFAGALAASLSPEQLGHGRWLISLASFNLGIEAFQLLLIGLAAPALHWLERYSWSVYFRQAAGVAILGVGLAWFVARLY